MADGITLTLRKLMGLDFTSAPTLEQIVIGLQTAKRFEIVQQTKWLLTVINVCLAAFTAIFIVQKIIAIIKQLKPILNLITKIGAALPPSLNVSILAEIASDLVETVIMQIKGILNQIIDKVIETILDFPSTIPYSVGT